MQPGGLVIIIDIETTPASVKSRVPPIHVVRHEERVSIL
jgi:hypothetical protein